MAVKKAKAKEWFTIIAPPMFEEREIGKTMTSDPNTLIGRRITTSMMELSTDVSKYYIKFFFRISKINGNKAIADFDGSECLRDYISRMVLRRVRRIDTVQDLKTKDGIGIRVKGLAVISKKMKTSISKVMRSEIKEMIKDEVEKSTLEELVQNIISDEIKNKIFQSARKIYPVRNFEIRKTEIIR